MTDYRAAVSYHVRDVTRDDFEAIIDVRNRSFGMTGDPDAWKRMSEPFVAGRRFLLVSDGADAVAAARIWDFGQWWRGRVVRMAGVAGVVVAPEHRGRGAATLLMRAMLARASELGYPISALYPASLPPYRRVGYEIAGARHRSTFDADALRVLRVLSAGPADVRRGGPADAPTLLEHVRRRRVLEAASGMLAADEASVRDWLGDEGMFCYLAEDGFVVYRWDGADLLVEELVAGSETTTRALWATVGSGASIARRVHAYAGPDDPVHLLIAHEARHDNQLERWMLRLVDAPAAIQARGWPPAFEAEIPLTVDDADLPANSGTWLLRVTDGAASLVPGPEEGLRMGARGLAALYAGTPVSALRLGGLVTRGSPELDHVADAAFAGPTPYLLDYF